jgi:hypothetical protein
MGVEEDAYRVSLHDMPGIASLCQLNRFHILFRGSESGRHRHLRLVGVSCGG